MCEEVWEGGGMEKHGSGQDDRLYVAFKLSGSVTSQ